MTSDRAVIVSSPSGAAFADFYQAEHEGQVRRAYLMLGDSGLAHDVVANAFISLYQRWDSVDHHGAYLNRCVLNGCRDSGRKSSRERAREHVVEDRGEPDRIDELGDVLGQLPFKPRAAVVLRYYAGWSEQEIADYLGCRPGTVGSLIHRGLRALRQILTIEGNHHDQ